MNAVSKIKDNKKNQIEINSLKKSLLNFKFQKSSGQLEKTAEIRKVRKKIARLKTEMKQKGEVNA